MKYHHGVSLHRRRKYIKRVYIFLISLAVIAGLIILAVRLDAYLQNSVHTDDATTTEQTNAYFASSTSVFTTQYFQFQTEDNWAEIPSESSDTKFVYRGLNGSIVQEELIIYVNKIPSDLAATRVLPVEPASNNRELTPGNVSGHCKKASKEHNLDERVLTYQKVTLNCDIDNTQFNVLVGVVGDSTRMVFERPDGSTADYSILYRNVEAVPDASELLQIMQTFQIR